MVIYLFSLFHIIYIYFHVIEMLQCVFMSLLFFVSQYMYVGDIWSHQIYLSYVFL